MKTCEICENKLTGQQTKHCSKRCGYIASRRRLARLKKLGANRTDVKENTYPKYTCQYCKKETQLDFNPAKLIGSRKFKNFVCPHFNKGRAT